MKKADEETTESEDTDTLEANSIKTKFNFLQEQLFEMVEGDKFSKQIKKRLK